MRGQNFLPATASPADSARSILILRGKLELISISILLFCSTEIISTGQMHLYPALLLHRDYFHRSDASLSGSFSPQGLFRPAGCISILLFCSTGIISPRPDASLSGSFAPQGLFRPDRMHPYLTLLFHRDYFHRSDASLSGSFAPQGLFRPDRMHLYLALLLHRDYFDRLNASLSGFFALQGLFRPGQLHLCLALFLHRDYFGRPDASLSYSFVPQGLFRPVSCISILLFFSTGIISTCQIEVLPEFLIFFQLLHFYFSLLDVELPFSVCQEQPFWHH